MTLSLRHRETGAFLTRKGQWTYDVRKAWRFTSLRDAVHAETRFKLSKVELYAHPHEDRSRRGLDPLRGYLHGARLGLLGIAD